MSHIRPGVSDSRRPGQVIEVASGSYPKQIVTRPPTISERRAWSCSNPRIRARVAPLPAWTISQAALSTENMKIGSFFNYGFNGGTQTASSFATSTRPPSVSAEDGTSRWSAGTSARRCRATTTGQQQPCVAKFPGQSTPAPRRLHRRRDFHDHNEANGKHTECLQIGGSNRLIDPTEYIPQLRADRIDPYHAIRLRLAVQRHRDREQLLLRQHPRELGAARQHPVQPKRTWTDHSVQHVRRLGRSARYSVFATFDDRPPASPSAQIYGNASTSQGIHNRTYGPCELAAYSHNVWRGASCSRTDVNATPRFVSLADLHLRAGLSGNRPRRPRAFLGGTSMEIGARIGRAPDAGADERRLRRN